MKCSTCRIRPHCISSSLVGFAASALEEMTGGGRRLPANVALFRHADSFSHLYAVRSGMLMSVVSLDDGRDQVSGFHVPGEVLGFDAIAQACHSSTAIALEDSEVCTISYVRLMELSSSVPSLQRHLVRLMSLQVRRQHETLLMLGSMSAEERAAAFLLDLSSRYRDRGYSRTSFHLRMTRADIGSYLGMKVETVCRSFAALQRLNLIRMDKKAVHIIDMDGLRRRTDAPTSHSAIPQIVVDAASSADRGRLPLDRWLARPCSVS